MTTDYYQVLGVSKSASDAEIRTAYRKLALKYHPDKNQSPDAEQKFRDISTAYGMLIDPEKRRTYNMQSQKPGGTNSFTPNYTYFCDANGVFTPFMGSHHFFPTSTTFQSAFFGSNPFNIYDMSHIGRGSASSFHATTPLRDLLHESNKRAKHSATETSTNGRYNFRSKDYSTAGRQGFHESQKPGRTDSCSSGSQKGQDGPSAQQQQHSSSTTKEYDLPLALLEVLNGCTKDRTITCQVADPYTKKRLKVEKQISISVQPGWKAGTKITFPGEGDVDESGVAADIIFVVRDQPHPYFQRDKADLRYTAQVTLKESLCGATVVVPTLTGSQKIVFKKIINPQTVQKIPGQGLPVSGEPSKRGDIIVSFDICFPDNVSKEMADTLASILP